MATTGSKIISGLRMLFALFVLLFNSVAPSVKLMWPEPVTCGMECCLESGVCYCSSGSHSRSGKRSRERYVGEKSTDALEASQPVEIVAATITSLCPPQCAQLPAGFQKHSIARAHPPRLAFIAGAACRLFTHAPFLARDILTAESHSPRAPPVIIL
jgi:hypothetical protein